MAYSSSLLSFMLENLNKTVVLTGSQIPISELRNDAIDNLLGSLIVAGTFLIPEVIIYFNNKVIRGNRATKHDSSMLEAFGSPNCDPIATYDVNFQVSWDRVLKYHSGKFSVFSNLEGGISFLTMSPCMHIETVKLVMNHSKAVILAGYGMGNLPSNDKNLMRCIAEAISNNVIVVIKT
jgi:lysophospholipase